MWFQLFQKEKKMPRRIAADGKPFDIDNLGRATFPDEVEVIQYLRPNGLRRRITVPYKSDLIAKATGMIIEAECLPDGNVAIWVRNKDEDEEKQLLDIAVNGPGERSPSTILEKLINEKFGQLLHKKEVLD
jgi:hypothetical protein